MFNSKHSTHPSYHIPHPNGTKKATKSLKISKNFILNYFLVAHPQVESLLLATDTVEYENNYCPQWVVSTELGHVVKTPHSVTIEFDGTPTSLRGISNENTMLFSTIHSLELTRLNAIAQILS